MTAQEAIGHVVGSLAQVWCVGEDILVRRIAGTLIFVQTYGGLIAPKVLDGYVTPDMEC